MVRIFGILNVTRDSFSDGGRYLEPAAALARAHQLVGEGADVVDVGAESTHPDAEDVPAEEELRRLEPVVRPLLADGVEVSVDTVKASVMRTAQRWGVQWLNDVAGMRDPDSIAAAAAGTARIVVMFSRSPVARALRSQPADPDVVATAEAFLRDRASALERAGVARERIVLDPGMGLFLGEGPAPSLDMLRALPRLRQLGLPLLVSVSRKSFLGALTGRPPDQRGAATLCAEVWAALQGVDFLRTHEPGPLRDGLALLRALGAVR
jgi:dihydropteroate synthase type 2